MGVTTIKARIAADNPEMAGVSSVTSFGHELTGDYVEYDVTDAVFGKFKGNPCIDVQVRKGRGVQAEPAPVEPEPEPPQG